jgi:thiamine pyrophosphokinase
MHLQLPGFDASETNARRLTTRAPSNTKERRQKPVVPDKVHRGKTEASESGSWRPGILAIADKAARGYALVMQHENNCAPPTVMLANGAFPTHAVPLAVLRAAKRIVCCDGAAEKLLAAGFTPTAIVGDLDSLPDTLRQRFADRLVREPGQNDNDLSKAFRFCLQKGWGKIVILGATGLREDHTLGNLALLADFATQADVKMLTDAGVFFALHQTATFATFPGQPVSVFSFDPQTAITSDGLQYHLVNLKLTRWWQATLNAATGDSATLTFSGGPLLVFQAHPA